MREIVTNYGHVRLFNLLDISSCTALYYLHYSIVLWFFQFQELYINCRAEFRPPSFHSLYSSGTIRSSAFVMSSALKRSGSRRQRS